MLIIGCDFHTRYQQIAMVDSLTGELTERRLEHESGQADTFYRGLPKPVRVRKPGTDGTFSGIDRRGWNTIRRRAIITTTRGITILAWEDL